MTQHRPDPRATTSSTSNTYRLCMLCNEPITGTVFGYPGGHRECMLREVLGGIGHHLGHEYWCLQRHDPDAGLTFHQSAVLVSKLVELLGLEAVADDAVPPTTQEPPCPSTPT